MLLKKELLSLPWITCTAAIRSNNPTTTRGLFIKGPTTTTTTTTCTATHTTLFGGTSSQSQSKNSTTMSNYWNREDSQPSQFAGRTVTQPARILSLSDPDDPNNVPLHEGPLPEGSKLLAIGTCLQEFDIKTLMDEAPNVLFVSHPNARQPLADLLVAFPSIRWVHTRSAGIDFCTSPTLAALAASGTITVTNAKGCFSSTLAEYTLMVCSYFAKDLPRLWKQKKDSNWEKYPILELRGATLGVIGYGDIGRAAAKLAKAYGMKVLALRRNPQKSLAGNDPLVDAVYGNDSINTLFAQSDYILCAAPLTPETENMIGKEQFDSAKKGAVFINVGRGPIVDETALIEALQDGGRLKGAGLDVTTIEPLPKDSPLWKLENVLLSPHNMDMTETFMKESTEFFVRENLPRYLHGMDLLNPVDPAAGY